MKCEEAQELITALVDNELNDPEGSLLESHLKDCPKCQFVFLQEQNLKREIHAAGIKLYAPADLRERILSNRRIFPERAYLAKGWKNLISPRRRVLRPALVLGVLVVLLLPTFYLIRSTDRPIALAALEIHKKVLEGDISLTKAASQDEMKENLIRSVEGRFAPMGYDLSMVGLHPEGGMVQEVKGRKVLVTVYEGKGLSLACFTFIGTDEDAPEKADIFFDPEKKIKFYTFSHGDIHGVLHREGNVICILVSKMPMMEILALARAKAQPS